MPSNVMVKICGLRRPIEARAAVDAGADLLGVILSQARRRVTREEAAEILAEAPKGVVKVGVFVDPELEEVESAIEIAGLHMVQLCGAESPEFCSRISVPVLKSFRITLAGLVPDPAGYPGPVHHVDAPGVPGGAGIEWDWTQAAVLAARFPVLLAGGLKPETVGEVIRAVSPWGVDVSSGVESEGMKDLAKVRQFVAAAKG